MNKSIVWYIGVWFLCTRIICEYEPSFDVFCSINKNFKMKSLMKTRKQKETGEKESEAAGKRGTATGSSAEKRVRKTVENPTETGSALRKTGEETAEMGNVETTVSGAVPKE